MKKSIVGIMLALVLVGQAETPVKASEIEVKEDQQHVIYRIYVDNEVVGSISDITAYNQFLETKMRTLLAANPGQIIQEPTNVVIKEEISLLPTTNANDAVILKAVEEKANFKVSANLIKIGDNVTNFVISDKSVVEEIVFDLMAFYSNEKDFKYLSNPKNTYEALKEEGSQYVGVKLSDETLVKFEQGVFDAKKLLSAEQARSLILYGRTEPKTTFTFNEGSSLSNIASDFNLTEAELVLLNPGVDKLSWAELLGTELDVTQLNPLVSIETEEETLEFEELSYETEYVDDDSILKGTTQVKQAGEEGKSLTRTMTVSVDGVEKKTDVLEDKVVSEPVNEIIARGTKVEVVVAPTPAPSTGGSTSNSTSGSTSGSANVVSGGWTWPTTSRNVTCGYLCYSGHYGIDINASVGQPVFAAKSGVVVSAGYDGGYGNSIVINHNNGYYTRYAHLSSINVSSGQSVVAGQTIGGAGNTGNSSGPHLHFEIRTNLGWQPSYAPNPLSFY